MKNDVHNLLQSSKNILHNCLLLVLQNIIVFNELYDKNTCYTFLNKNFRLMHPTNVKLHADSTVEYNYLSYLKFHGKEFRISLFKAKVEHKRGQEKRVYIILYL